MVYAVEDISALLMSGQAATVTQAKQLIDAGVTPTTSVSPTGPEFSSNVTQAVKPDIAPIPTPEQQAEVYLQSGGTTQYNPYTQTYTETNQPASDTPTPAPTATPTKKFYQLQIGYAASIFDPAKTVRLLYNRGKPIAKAFGFTLDGVVIEDYVIYFDLSKVGSPFPIALAYALIALIGIIIAGIVIVSVTWHDLKSKEIEGAQIRDISEVIEGIRTDDTLDPQTKETLLLDLSKSLGNVSEHEEGTITSMITSFKQAIPLLLGLAIISAVSKAVD